MPSATRRFHVAALVLGASLAHHLPLAAETSFDSVERLRAADHLAPELLSGPDWRVAESATSDGFALAFSVESRFGTFPAHGAAEVAVRVGEIRALAELERISKSSVFVDAVKRSAVGQIETVASFAAQPVETVKAIPGGVKRWMQKTSYRAAEAYDDAKKAAESSGKEGDGGDGDRSEKAKEVARQAALDQLKITSAERRWYAELGVDPYTDNAVLRKAITSYARIDGLTSFGMKFVGLPSIPGVGAMRKTMDLVWTTDPWELRRRNRKLLLEMGVAEEAARAFEDGAWFSLTQQTAFVGALHDFAGVGGRETLFERALATESRDDARLLVQATELLLRFQNEQEPFAAFLAGTRLPVARTRSGELVALTPADAFFWTAEMAEAATTFAAVWANEPAKARRLWLVGEASPRFRAEAGALGWQVRDRWRHRDDGGTPVPAPGR